MLVFYDTLLLIGPFIETTFSGECPAPNYETFIHCYYAIIATLFVLILTPPFSIS